MVGSRLGTWGTFGDSIVREIMLTPLAIIKGLLYSWSQKHRAVKKELPQILQVLLYMAMVKDKQLSCKDLPYFSGIAVEAASVDEIAPEVVAAAAASSDLVVNTVKQSNANLDALRRATPDNLRLTAIILANRTSSKLAMVIEFVSNPLEQNTSIMLTKTTTRIGCKLHFVEQAKRQSDGALQETFDLMRDHDKLADLGLLEFGQLIGGWSAKEDGLVSEVMLSLILKTVGNEIEHSSFYCMRPPFKFFQYLSEDIDDKKEVMDYCKVMDCIGPGLLGRIVNPNLIA